MAICGTARHGRQTPWRKSACGAGETYTFERQLQVIHIDDSNDVKLTRHMLCEWVWYISRGVDVWKQEV